MLQTLYVLSKEIFLFLGLKSAVYNLSGFKSRAGYNGACTVLICAIQMFLAFDLTLLVKYVVVAGMEWLVLLFA